MDANEHIYHKSIGRALTKPNGLNMSNVIGNHTRRQFGATFFRGSTMIDRIWAMQDNQVTGKCVMLTRYGEGDHRLFVVDFLTSSLVGHTHPKVICSQARRLNTAIPGTELRYNS